jgi:hypothetical protein
VAELIRTRAAVVSAYAALEALDALRPAGAFVCRVAPDESMFVSSPLFEEELLRDVGAVTAGDADAIVLDATDGWAAWTLDGDGAGAAFERLSHIRRQRGFMQGDVAALPARIIAESGRIHLFVPSMLGECLRERILARCGDVVEQDEPRDWHPEALR